MLKKDCHIGQEVALWQDKDHTEVQLARVSSHSSKRGYVYVEWADNHDQYLGKPIHTQLRNVACWDLWAGACWERNKMFSLKSHDTYLDELATSIGLRRHRDYGTIAIRNCPIKFVMSQKLRSYLQRNVLLQEHVMQHPLWARDVDAKYHAGLQYSIPLTFDQGVFGRTYHVHSRCEWNKHAIVPVLECMNFQDRLYPKKRYQDLSDWFALKRYQTEKWFCEKWE